MENRLHITYDSEKNENTIIAKESPELNAEELTKDLITLLNAIGQTIKIGVTHGMLDKEKSYKAVYDGLKQLESKE